MAAPHRARSALALLALGCGGGSEPVLFSGHGVSTAPAVACVEFRVERVREITWVASPSIVGPNTRAEGVVVRTTAEGVGVGDPVWVEFDRFAPPRWEVGDRGTLEVDGDRGITRVREGGMPEPCPSAP